MKTYFCLCAGVSGVMEAMPAKTSSRRVLIQHTVVPSASVSTFHFGRMIRSDLQTLGHDTVYSPNYYSPYIDCENGD